MNANDGSVPGARDVVVRQLTTPDQVPHIVRGAVEDGRDVLDGQEHGGTHRLV